MPNIVNVIEFQGNVDQVVWKSPVENFNSGTQLIVDEAHEAVVLIEGRAELYGPGPHTLETENHFGLNAIHRFATGGDTPFPCKVFFVKKNHSMDMKWGTRDVLTVNDPKLDIIMHLMLRGNLTYTIDNSIKFLEKFTGFTSDFKPEDTVEKFRGIISTEVTDCITKIINVAHIDYLDINAHLKEISQLLIQPLSTYFEDYGTKLVYFNVETITSREDDLAEVQAAKSQARARVINAHSEAEAREIQGYDWLTEKKADILMALAGNDGSMGGMMGAGIGVMAMGPMGQNLTNVVDDLFDPNASKKANPFPDNGTAAPNAPQPFNVQEETSASSLHVDVRTIFGNEGSSAGDSVTQQTLQPDTAPTQVMPTMPVEDEPAPEAPAAPAGGFDPAAPAQPSTPAPASAAPGGGRSVIERAQELKQLLDMGFISQEEFDAKKAQLMREL